MTKIEKIGTWLAGMIRKIHIPNKILDFIPELWYINIRLPPVAATEYENLLSGPLMTVILNYEFDYDHLSPHVNPNTFISQTSMIGLLLMDHAFQNKNTSIC